MTALFKANKKNQKTRPTRRIITNSGSDSVKLQ